MLSCAATFALIVAALAILQLYLLRSCAKLPFHFDGRVKRGFEPVQRAFKQNFEKGWDNEGAAFAVFYENEPVVDIWGGYADYGKNETWKKNTLSVVFSTTKAACAISLALLVDRGLVKYDDLVVKHWPEFGKHGKDNITVRMLSSHQAGLVLLDSEITFDTIRDWKRTSRMIENQKPNWPPSTKTAGYHILTYGFLIDQLIRRIDNERRSLGKFFSDEIAKPHNLEFFIGLPPEYDSRVARLTPPGSVELIGGLMFDPYVAIQVLKMYVLSDARLFKASLKNPSWLSPPKGAPYIFNDVEFRRLEIGGANGVSNARSMAKLMCLFGSGQLISRKTIRMLSRPLLEHSKDEILNIDMTYGHGFEYSEIDNGNYLIGHSGYGGQNVKVDLKRNLCFAYLRNGLSNLVADLNWSWNNLKDSLYYSLRKMNSKK